MSKLESCVTVIREWVTDNFLKLNEDKSELLYWDQNVFVIR